VTDTQAERSALSLRERLDRLGWGVACRAATFYLVAVMLRLAPSPLVGLSSELGLLGTLIAGPSLVLYVLGRHKRLDTVSLSA